MPSPPFWFVVYIEHASVYNALPCSEVRESLLPEELYRLNCCILSGFGLMAYLWQQYS